MTQSRGTLTKLKWIIFQQQHTCMLKRADSAFLHACYSEQELEKMWSVGLAWLTSPRRVSEEARVSPQPPRVLAVVWWED